MQDKAISNEVLARIYGAYLGSQIQYEDIDGKKIIATLTGISRVDGLETTYKKPTKGCVGDYLSFKPNGNHNCDALHAKLILTPLSDITDKHAIEVAKMLGLTDAAKVVRMVDAVFIQEDTYQIQISHNGYCCMRKNKQLYNTDTTPITDYLRSKFYAIPFNGIDLFQAGIATKKEGGNG